jgi:hypothetical protein
MSGIQQMLFGGSNPDITYTFSNGDTGIITVPAGMNHVTIKVYGGGGDGGTGTGLTPFPGGGGGGSGGLVVSYYACTPGLALEYATSTKSAPFAGSSVVISNTMTITTMSSNSARYGNNAIGSTPGTGGAGGTATGGNVSNTAGLTGGTGGTGGVAGIGAQHGVGYIGFGGNGGTGIVPDPFPEYGGLATITFTFTSA